MPCYAALLACHLGVRCVRLTLFLHALFFLHALCAALAAPLVMYVMDYEIQD